MNTSRLTVALAVLGSFVAGICVGSFTGNGSLLTGHGGKGLSRSGGTAAANSRSPTKGAGGEVLAGSEDEALAGEDLVKRVWTTLTIGDENDRHAEWLRLLPSLTRQDALAIRDLFRKMDAQGRHFDFEWFSFWPRWGEVDGSGALAYLANNEHANWRPDAAEMILRGWAKMDANAARAWLSANSASPFYEGALRGYLDGLARTDLARATTEALTLGTGKDMSKLMEVLTEQALQQRQLGGLLEWWRNLPDDPSEGSARMGAIEHIYHRLELADASRAQELFTELAGTPYRSDDRLGEVAEKIAASDPAKAVEWVASLPPSPQDGHYIAIGRTMNAWGEHDAPAAETWLNNLPPSPLRDQALIAYARYLQGSQSTAADQWLAQVQDQQLLQRQQQRAAQVTLFSTELNQVRRATFSSGGKLLIETIESAPAPSQ